MKKQRIAIIGGSFDPIHNGHLAAAAAAKYELEAELVYFIPAGKPPHKGRELASARHRLEMTELAIKHIESFVLSDIEVKREGKSYTIDTIHEIMKLHPGAKLSFIVGTDMFFSLEKWKDAEKLFRLITFAVVARPGYDNEKIQAEADRLREKHKAKIRLIESSGVELSSSEIRERMKFGKPSSFLLPKAVESYIIEKELYSGFRQINAVIAEKCCPLADKVMKMVSPKRFNHILGVADTALKLADLYKADMDKALIAAILHDCAKGRSENELDHAEEGALLAKEQFGINDDEILNAVRYHTIGRMDMTLLEKIIFVADCIEPSRSQIPGRAEINEAAYKDLDYALFLCLKLKIDFTVRVKQEDMCSESHELYAALRQLYNEG